VLLVLACGIALRLLSAPSPFWLGLLGPIAVLLALGLLASRDLIGWGDAKLITAVSVGVPPDRLLTLLLAIVLAGGVLSCCYLAARCVLRRSAASPDRARTDGYWGAGGSGTELLSAAMAGPGPGGGRFQASWPAPFLSEFGRRRGWPGQARP
jgi:Flp pilus assembly protein protease CpaA